MTLEIVKTILTGSIMRVFIINLNPYVYCYQSPVILVDPNGKQVKAIKEWWMRNQMTTRTLGFIKGVGGVVGAGIGGVGGVAT